MSILKKNQRRDSPPIFNTQVHTAKGVNPGRIPEGKRLLRGLPAHTISVRDILQPVIDRLSKRDASEFRELFGQLRASGDYQRSLEVTELISQLLKQGRLAKRFRRQTNTVEDLLFAGLVHTLSPEALRRVGLAEIAEIITREDPKTPSQFMLQGVIEYLKIQDQKPTLVLLDMIQDGGYGTVHSLILTCLVLDLLDIRAGKLSPEEARAQNIAQQFLAAAGSIAY